MCKHYDELTNKVVNLEAVSTTPTKASKRESSNMSKNDASTSCNNLCLDSPLCNQVCIEKVVVETCTQEVTLENEQLKQEVACLTKYLTQVQGKMEQTQLHQDNTVKGVKKVDEGQTVVFYMCHKEGNKSYEYKVKNGEELRKKRETKSKQASSPTPTPTRWTRRPPHHTLLKKKKNDKVVAIKENKQANNGVKRFWVPKEIIFNMKSTKKVWITKGSCR